MSSLRDFTDMVKAIQKNNERSIDYSKPTTFMFGTVTNVNPLKVNVEQRMVLDKHSLILSENVTDHDVSMMVDDERKTYRIYNALKTRREGCLVTSTRGQKFIILDRVMT